MEKAEIQALFKAWGLRATPARIALLGALATAQKPKSAEELHARVAKGDLVTVYRNVQSLVKVKAAREVRFKDGVVRYEFNDGEAFHHHHVVCTRCGVIDELPHCDMPAIEKSALKAARSFSVISEHTLEFFGTCRTCAKVGVV